MTNEQRTNRFWYFPPMMLLLSDPVIAEVPVRECGEDLIDVRQSPDLMLDYRKQDTTGSWARLRAGVVGRLIQAQRLLPVGRRLLVIEGYRPLTLQRHYFDSHYAAIAREHPEWSNLRLHSETSKHVAPPQVAPHPSGAAVDITLADTTGNEVDMGTAVNATPTQSANGCFTAASNITETARTNRDILDDALSAAGLINYPPEWWHYSYGDPYWAASTGAPHALYAPR